MKYLNVVSKLVYYLNFFGVIIVLGVSSFIYSKVIEYGFETGDFEGVMPMGIITSFFLLMALFETRFVYMRINTIDKTIEYGSIFFYQEAGYEQVKSIKKLWFPRGIYKLKIGDSVHYVKTSREDIKNIIDELGIE